MDNLEDYKQTLILKSEQGDCNAMNNLAGYYRRIGDDNNMLKYFVMAANMGNYSAISNLSYYLKDHISENIELIANNLKILDPNIVKAANKYIVENDLSYQYSTKIDKCCICEGIKNRALIRCNHNVCFNCAIRISRCPLCMINSNIY